MSDKVYSSMVIIASKTRHLDSMTIPQSSRGFGRGGCRTHLGSFCFFLSWTDPFCVLWPQILYSKAENARIVVQIDNTKLAADDFRSK